jgi:hypothetical protein
VAALPPPDLPAGVDVEIKVREEKAAAAK